MLIANEQHNVEIRKVVSWLIFIIGTLILPCIFLIWLAMQIAARVIAPNVNDVSIFVTQVSWWVGGVSTIYPFIWGIRLYPNIKKYISEKLLSLPTNEKKPESQQPIAKKTKGNTK